MISHDPNASKEQVEDFYNNFKDHQKQLGVNIRHRTIFRNLVAAGLSPSSTVLEVGCGIGTVSSLVLRYLKAGKLVGADISAESIGMARKTLGKFKNAEFIVTDMTGYASPPVFDFIVLPDVLEHIPVAQHAALFKTLAAVSTPSATMLINFPEPDCLDWLRAAHPEKLQIIDQSLSMQDLLNNAYPAGWKLQSMHSYGLQYDEPEYTSIVMAKRTSSPGPYTRKNWLRLGLSNLFSRLT